MFSKLFIPSLHPTKISQPYFEIHPTQIPQHLYEYLLTNLLGLVIFTTFQPDILLIQDIRSNNNNNSQGKSFCYSIVINFQKANL